MKRLESVGEFGLIDRIRKRTRRGPSTIVGIGDDAAVLKSPGKKLLLKTDMLIEGRHFTLDAASAREIGRKALAVNLSDVAAMGGTPTHAVVAVGLPSRLGLKFAEELAAGIESVARRHGVDVVGGDTNASDVLVVSIALLGRTGPRTPLRSDAKPGDVVFVTGRLGGSLASRRHLTFEPRLAESRYLVENYKVHAMMDVSDGLASDARRIADASRVRVFLAYESIPVSPDAFGMDAALADGEDFELLFTLDPREAARLTMARPKGLGPFVPVGKIARGTPGVFLVRPDGSAEPLPARGFDHFR